MPTFQPLQYVATQTPDGRPALKITIEDLPIYKNGAISTEQLDLLSYFCIDTYRSVNDGDETKWDNVFGPANKLFESLSIEDQNEIATFLIFANFKILGKLSSENVAEIEDLAANIANDLVILDDSIDLIKKIQHYVENDIPIQAFDDVGNRPQDREEMTFHRPEIVHLTGIVVLCKILSPIYGGIFESTAKRLDKNIRITDCMRLTTDILVKHYNDLMLKLDNFINVTTKRAYRDDFTSAYNGISIQSAAIYQYCTMLVRWFVNVNIYEPDTNIMTYITSCLREAIKSQSITANSTNSICERKDPKDFTRSSKEEGNQSDIECESRTTTKPADVPLLIEFAVQDTINRMLIQYKINPTHYESALAFYKSNPINITPMNNYLVSTFFGSHIGGALGIPEIGNDMYTKLTTLLQFILFVEQRYLLIDFITLIPNNNFKLKTTPEDTKIRFNWDASYEYKNCKSKFTITCSEKTWDSKLRQIAEDITSKEFIYSTAPIFYDLRNIENHNGRVYDAQLDLFRHICGFFLSIFDYENGDMM